MTTKKKAPPPEPEEKFCYAKHPDEGYLGEFESREAALSEAIVVGGLEPGDEAWTGIIEPVAPEKLASPAGIVLDSLMDSLGDEAGELVGEVAEDWPPRELDSKILKKMDEELCALVTKWIKEHMPYHFHCVNHEQRHVVIEEDLPD